MKNTQLLTGTLASVLIGLLTWYSLQEPRQALKTDYEPSAAYPYGRHNPEAPAELQQFAFLIGTCECTVERFNYPDGKSISYQAVWTNSWTMNGWAIKDRVFSAYDAPISIRIFDDQAKKWKMTYFIPKPYYSGEWVGQKVGERMVMEKEEPLAGRKAFSRLTFYEISDRGFKWMSENIFEDSLVFTDWKIDCLKLN